MLVMAMWMGHRGRQSRSLRQQIVPEFTEHQIVWRGLVVREERGAAAAARVRVARLAARVGQNSRQRRLRSAELVVQLAEALLQQPVHALQAFEVVRESDG